MLPPILSLRSIRILRSMASGMDIQQILHRHVDVTIDDIHLAAREALATYHALESVEVWQVICSRDREPLMPTAQTSAGLWEQFQARQPLDDGGRSP